MTGITEKQLDRLERDVEERRMLSWGEMYDLIAEVRRLRAEVERLRAVPNIDKLLSGEMVAVPLTFLKSDSRATEQERDLVQEMLDKLAERMSQPDTKDKAVEP